MRADPWSIPRVRWLPSVAMTATRPHRRTADPRHRVVVFGFALAALLATLAVCSGTSAVAPPTPAARPWLLSGTSTAAPPVSADPQRSARPVTPVTGQRATGHGGRDGAGAAPEAEAGRAYGPALVCSPFERGAGHGSGCSGPTEHLADATLPGPPPQPAPASPPRLPLAPAGAAPGPDGPLSDADLAPDLHLLQVMRT